MAADFGTELSCVRDIDQNGSVVTGPRVVAEALARRLSTPRGRVIDDPNFGFDLTQFINDDTTKSGLVAMQSGASAECLKDERVLQAVTTASLLNGVLTVRVNFTTAAGPFSLVLAVSQTSVAVLSVT